MQITAQLPVKMGIGIGEGVQHVMRGIIAGWINLPIDVQKMVTHAHMAYEGSTTVPLATDVFDIEVKLAVTVDGVLTDRSVSIKINDFRGDVSATTSLALREAVLGEIEELASEDTHLARLLL